MKSKIACPFTFIFLLFHLLLIFPIKTSKQSFVRKLIRLIYALLNVFLALLTVLPITHILVRPNSTKESILHLLTLTMRVTYRYTLCHKYHQLRSIAEKFSSEKKMSKSNRRRWIYIGIAITSILQIATSTYFVIQSNTFRIDVKTYNLTRMVLEIIYFTSTELLFRLPLNIFSVYYVSVCERLKDKIRNFSDIFTKAEIIDSTVLLKCYSRVVSEVESLDRQLSLVMFLSTMDSSGAIYTLIKDLLHPIDIIQSDPQRFINWTNFLASMTCLVTMSVSASSVAEAVSDVGNLARSFSSSRVSPSFEALVFATSAQSGASLTVWGMAPIRRNFIVGIVGAIFTYVVLIENLDL